MARKLKTFITAIGFYDLAIAAPSMKAALEAWGSRQNLFHEGLAWETDDPAIAAATLEKPGVVLRRAVGTNQPFREKAPPPSALPDSAPQPRGKSRPQRSKKRADASPAAQKAAIIKFAEAKARRDQARQREEARLAAEEQAEQARREKQASKAEAALAKARTRHEKTMAKLERQQDTLDRKMEAERARWRKIEKDLTAQIYAAGA